MKVGDTVTLTVKNPLWGNRSAYAGPMAEFRTYTGTILPSPSWVGADQLCLSTGTVEFPFRVLDRDRIIGSQESLGASQSRVFSIEGSKGKNYVVTLENGLWGCNCVGFGFRRSCTHVLTAKAQVAGVTVEPKKEKSNGQAKNNKKSACFNYKSALESKSKVNRAISPIRNEDDMAKVEKHGDKTKVAIEVMENNVGKSYDEVCELIAQAIGVPVARARVYYRHKVINKLAKGYENMTRPYPWEGKARTPKTPKAKTKKVSAEKLLNDLGLKKTKYTGKVKAEVTKSSDEIAKIKQANLDRMKQVSAKLSKVRGYMPGQVAREEAPTPSDFDPQLAREEVAAIIAEIDRDRAVKVAPKMAHE